MTSSQQLQSSSFEGVNFLVEPFWRTVTPLIFMIAFSVTLVYILFLVSLMAHSRRPWLQRLAALSAVVSLTFAAVLMWRELEKQNNMTKVYNADELRAIRTDTALKILRIISNSIIWLSQVQILIRLFPRHRDKVVIKWTGLCLIVLGTVFAVLNDLVHPSPVNPKSTSSLMPAIPVMAYIFHITLDALYAICVLFYTVSSGRWRHAYALNNLLIALVSIVAFCSPVVFFCLDIWNSQVEGWGDYVRWACSVAATVIVWDWIDHIEARIVKDTKMGILGREVFEDEMYDGDKKKSTKDARSNNTTANIFNKIWTRKSTPIGHDAVGIDLPTIKHPLAQSKNLSNHTGSTSSTLNSHDSSTDATYAANSLYRSTYDRVLNSSQRSCSNRSEAESTRNTEPRTNGSSSILQATTQPRSLQDEHWVHPGFQSGDYWQDEKTGVDSELARVASSPTP